MSILAQNPRSVEVPLREEPPGVLRVGDSRVLLELVISAYRQRTSPEGIVRMYDSLQLKDVFAVIAWCLEHPSAVDEYLRQCDERAAALKAKIESTQVSSPTKEALLARARATGLPF